MCIEYHCPIFVKKIIRISRKVKKFGEEKKDSSKTSVHPFVVGSDRHNVSQNMNTTLPGPLNYRPGRCTVVSWSEKNSAIKNDFNLGFTIIIIIPQIVKSTYLKAVRLGKNVLQIFRPLWLHWYFYLILSTLSAHCLSLYVYTSSYIHTPSVFWNLSE